MDNEYLKFIAEFTATDLRFWSYRPSKTPIEVKLFKKRILNSKQAIYLPFKLKNKIVKIIDW